MFIVVGNYLIVKLIDLVILLFVINKNFGFFFIYVLVLFIKVYFVIVGGILDRSVVCLDRFFFWWEFFD